MESLAGPHDTILLEARVYVDGVLVAYVWLETHSNRG
jgi:hypothetical protein